MVKKPNEVRLVVNMIHYNKLIRDKVPEIMLRDGKKIQYHAASTDKEAWYLLNMKLQEEVDEFGQIQSMDRLADILDVIEAIIEFKKYDKKEFEAVRENKNNQYGGFSRHWVLEKSPDEIGHRQEQGT